MRVRLKMFPQYVSQSASTLPSGGALDYEVHPMAMLQTPRLLLRPFADTDLERLAELMRNEDFMRFSLGVFTSEQTAAFLEKLRGWDREGKPSQFAVIFREDQQLIGYCGFFHQVLDGIEELEIGYRIDRAYWNRGIATEAARAVRNHAFDDLHLSRVISLIHPENLASRRVAEKNGMTVEKETVFRGFRALVFSLSRFVQGASPSLSSHSRDRDGRSAFEY
jgi:ribosomal-protein-alanine N-acetyltransferase